MITWTSSASRIYPRGAGPLRVSDRKRQVVLVRGRVLEDELVVVTSSNEQVPDPLGSSVRDCYLARSPRW
jgi:hypothetical protein